jgi:hypothetical protein
VVTLGSPTALGALRRVESWESIWAAAGAETVTVPLLGTGPDLTPAATVSVLRGVAAPEQLAWSRRALVRRLREIEPAAVVCVTTRAHHPALASTAPVVLDLVDSLADSYAQRAAALRGPRAHGYGLLARLHGRVERAVVDRRLVRVVAGHGDAARFGATWIPNVADWPGAPGPPGPDVPFDLVFFGTLAYPPNVEALRQLAQWWPTVSARRPGLRVLVAGARPGAEVTGLCGRHGWSLEPDFAAPMSVCRRARIAVAPLPHAAGVQNKVLEAAAAGLPQIVTTAVARGVGPDFPLLVADDAPTFAAHVEGLLDGPAAAALSARARRHLDAVYRPAAYAPWAAGLLRGTAQPAPQPATVR